MSAVLIGVERGIVCRCPPVIFSFDALWFRLQCRSRPVFVRLFSFTQWLAEILSHSNADIWALPILPRHLSVPEEIFPLWTNIIHTYLASHRCYIYLASLGSREETGLSMINFSHKVSASFELFPYVCSDFHLSQFVSVSTEVSGCSSHILNILLTTHGNLPTSAVSAILCCILPYQ